MEPRSPRSTVLILAQGKLDRFVAIDRVSRFACVEFRNDAGKMNGAEFLRGVVTAFFHAVLEPAANPNG